MENIENLKEEWPKPNFELGDEPQFHSQQSHRRRQTIGARLWPWPHRHGKPRQLLLHELSRPDSLLAA